MTWLQFIASVIGSVAWPTAIVVALVLMRRHLGPLLARLLELHLPGGTKAIFSKASFDDALAKGSEVIKKLEKPEQQETTPTFHEHIAVDSPGDPLARIIQAYAEIEDTLIIVRERLNIAPLYGPQFVMDFLSRDLLTPEVSQLFVSLKAARNSAAHGRFQPTDNEAAEYVRQAEVLKEALKAVARDFPEKKK
jgi:hypothetical protein